MNDKTAAKITKNKYIFINSIAFCTFTLNSGTNSLRILFTIVDISGSDNDDI
jgi:hypothetical protein